MIRDFWVKNYLSIGDKQELSFVAKGPASELVSEVAEDVFLYKLAILYGSNASGKSNMLIAMNEVFRLMVMPKSNATKKILGYIPFALTSDKPTEMHVSFFAEGIRYDYDVTFNGNYILKEILNYYPKKAKSLFYERTFVEDKVQADIKFGPSLKLQIKTQDSIRENTLNNHSVLSVCNKAAFKEDIPACSICKEIRCNAFPELHIFLNFVPFAFNFIFKAGFFILSTSLNDSWGYGCNTLNI